MAIIDKYQDVMDSRDIIERIEELESLREEAIEAGEDVERDELDFGIFSQGEREELATLNALVEEASASPDWTYGETLVRDSYWLEYITDLIDECYEDVRSAGNRSEWPYRHMQMDYESAADEAKADYLEVDFDGVTYWIRQ